MVSTPSLDTLRDHADAGNTFIGVQVMRAVADFRTVDLVADVIADHCGDEGVTYFDREGAIVVLDLIAKLALERK